MTRKILLAILLLLLSTPAWATNWCNDTNAELCLPCSEGSGTDVGDLSANNTTCTYNGAWGSDSMPKAYMDSYLDLDGSNDYVTCGTDAHTDFVESTSDFMVTFWCITYVLGNDFERYIVRESNGGGDGWMIARNFTAGDVGTRGTSFAIERSGDQDGISLNESVLADDTHYAVLYDWSEDKLTTYINGVKYRDAVAVSTAYTYGWPSTTDTTCIGARCTDASTQAESHINEIGMFSSIAYDATDIGDIMDNGLYEAAGSATPPQPIIMIF